MGKIRIYVFLFLGMVGCSVMGNDVVDRDFGFDYKADNAYLEAYINSMPLVSPGYDLGTSGSLESNIDFKHVLYNGENNLTFFVKKVDDSKESIVKILFKYWDVGGFEMPFESENNGFLLSFDFTEIDSCSIERGNEKVEVLSDGCNVNEKEGLYIISVDFKLDFTGFYESKYIDNAKPINNLPEIKDKLIAEFRKVYNLYKTKDLASLKDYVGPSLIKYSEDNGIELSKAFEVFYAKELKDDSFKLSDFSLEDSKIYVTSNRKLITFFDAPFSILNSETEETIHPIIYYWLDESGQLKVYQ